MRRLVRDYCFDYVTVPYSGDRIVDSVGHAYGMISLANPLRTTRRDGAEGEMVGSCDAMLALFRSIRKVAMTDAPVFISGESGTGKELTAVAIHERSARRSAPFVPINCGAIPAASVAIRTVRLRTRRVHGRESAQDRPGGSGQRRHAVPRRNRRPAARKPGEPAALPAGAQGRAAGRPRRDRRRRAHHLGHARRYDRRR